MPSSGPAGYDSGGLGRVQLGLVLTPLLVDLIDPLCGYRTSDEVEGQRLALIPGRLDLDEVEKSSEVDLAERRPVGSFQ